MQREHCRIVDIHLNIVFLFVALIFNYLRMHFVALLTKAHDLYT